MNFVVSRILLLIGAVGVAHVASEYLQPKTLGAAVLSGLICYIGSQVLSAHERCR